MYQFLLRAHSGLRWVVLFLLIASVIVAFMKWSKKENTFSEGLRKLFTYNLVGIHIQTLIGLVLYFISPKVQFVSGMMKETALRFYAVEHISMMLLAAILITVGHVKAKKQSTPQKYKTYLIFNAIALIIILASIPWPFRAALGAGWF